MPRIRVQSSYDVMPGLNALEAHGLLSCLHLPITVADAPEGLSLSFDGQSATICASDKPAFFRGMALLEEACSAGAESLSISQTPAFDTLCIMMDCSRNAVLHPATAQDLIRRAALMGYTAVMLYTEDTYEIAGHPYFGYMRGRYAAKELRELDDYADMFGIELIPCIQTLAHLNAIFRWPVYRDCRDTDDILLVGDDKTYQLLDDMLNAVSRCFRSRRINIGMDEAWALGQGRYLERHGHRPKAELMAEHLARVMTLCQRYGFRPMMWSDMFFRSGNPAFQEINGSLSPEALAAIPPDVSLIHWDYLTERPETIDRMLRLHQMSQRNVVFAGGAWKWSGLTPFIRYSLDVASVALDRCLSCGIRHVMVTAWGDGGGECSAYAVLPVMQQYAEACYARRMDDDNLDARLRVTTGLPLAQFLLLDTPNQLEKYRTDTMLRNGYDMNPSNYLLYQDPLLGLFDRHTPEGICRPFYRETQCRLSDAADAAGWLGYVFASSAALCGVLADKAELGLRLRKAYKDRNFPALKELADVVIPRVIAQVNKYYDCLFAQWMRENKPHGFDVQDIRFGALLQRLRTTRRIVRRYLDGIQPDIPELEEERLFADGRSDPGDSLHCRTTPWSDTVTVNVL